ncbi:sulfite exporter TauE/SafE family protein [Flavobacterium maritimum]|uniref:sulfite exporter TauE/SafE family protein n=1 Tax=Flavobacterium maritimum TaxID=3149042 RepID=UPI0032B48EA0
MTVADLLDTPLLLLLLPIVAFLYASVGHGGASGYLALMSAFSFPMTFMKPTALVLNILVSAVSFYFYYREKNFKWNLFYPFALSSIPFSFVGGYLEIDAFYYKIILATVLVFAVMRLLGFFGKEKNTINEINLPLALGFGALIGFLSGLLGIGGGIILSPVLLILGWATMKQAAAVSALFILTNSISGLFGFVSQGGTLPESSLVLIGVVFIGGLFGAYYGSTKFNSKALRYVLSAVIGIAIVKLYTTA